MKFEELRQLYKENFSLEYLGNSIENKMILICLICYITDKAKSKKPDITYYQVITKICKDLGGLPEEFIKVLAIICEDFSYGCTTFPTFNLKNEEIIPKIKEILTNYLPF